MRSPFLLSPAGKDYLWGGERLKTEFHKEISLSPLAETWECSVHPDGKSIVASGEHKGKTLADVLHDHPEYLGTHPKQNTFPILVKLIDAARDLSVQVHPDDDYAYTHEKGQLGKTEFWYVLSTPEEGGEIVYGFRDAVTMEEVEKSAGDGSIVKYLQRVPVEPGDVFFVRAGTVHAICAGTIVAEIQENSNLTYRLYDYDRTDASGKKRELHIKKAIEVLDNTVMPSPRQPMRVLKYRPGYASEFLARCRYFQVDRLLINTGKERPVPIESSSLSFLVFLCIDGVCTLSPQDGEPLSCRKGDCIFVPASPCWFRITGKAEFLRIHC
ncbi:MAG: class I mannose-6-phosphate isomerase [Lachnospiraceae bacterium]|nr:class I mannose-6-phosphate isomerase [Lachnospiraceae bacterium]